MGPMTACSVRVHPESASGAADALSDRSPPRLPAVTLTLAAIVLVALALGGCMGGPMGPMGPGMHRPGQGNDAQAPSPRLGAPDLVVVATDLSFVPGELRIRAGDTVNLTLHNRGRLYHDLTIEGLGLVLTAGAGERSSGALTVAEAGRYRFVCSVPGHAEAGMTGTLVVD